MYNNFGVLEFFNIFEDGENTLTSVEIKEIEYHLRTNTPFHREMDETNYDIQIVDYVKLKLRQHKIEKLKNKIKNN